MTMLKKFYPTWRKAAFALSGIVAMFLGLFIVGGLRESPLMPIYILFPIILSHPLSVLLDEAMRHRNLTLGGYIYYLLFLLLFIYYYLIACVVSWMWSHQND